MSRRGRGRNRSLIVPTVCFRGSSLSRRFVSHYWLFDRRFPLRLALLPLLIASDLDWMTARLAGSEGMDFLPSMIWRMI